MFRRFLQWLGYSQKQKPVYLTEPIDHVIQFTEWPNTFIKKIDNQNRIIRSQGRWDALRLTKSEAEKVCALISDKVGPGAFVPFKLDL